MIHFLYIILLKKSFFKKNEFRSLKEIRKYHTNTVEHGNYLQ
jgi:hypothetical protein